MATGNEELNVLFWDEVPERLKRGEQLELFRQHDYTIKSGFFVRVRAGGIGKVVIDRKGEQVRPLEVQAIDLYNLMAVTEGIKEFELPLLGEDGRDSDRVDGFIGVKKPNPRIRWTLRVEDEVVMGDRSNVLAFDVLDETLGRAAHMSATHVTVRIPDSIKTLFQSRERRHALISIALAKQNVSMRNWCDKNKVTYSMVNKVINRADDDSKIKKKLAALTNTPIDEMWPTIDWSDIGQVP